MTTFAGITPSASTQVNYTYRTNEAQYGNGYKQVSPDGANAVIITGSQIQWDNLSPSQWATLQAWLVANPPWVTWPGDGIALPTNMTFRLTKDGYQLTYQTGGVVQVQLNVESVY